VPSTQAYLNSGELESLANFLTRREDLSVQNFFRAPEIAERVSAKHFDRSCKRLDVAAQHSYGKPQEQGSRREKLSYSSEHTKTLKRRGKLNSLAACFREAGNSGCA